MQCIGIGNLLNILYIFLANVKDIAIIFLGYFKGI